MAACWASQYAITTRLIDQKSERTKAGHADGINSRTMEIFDSFGIAELVLRQAVGNMDAAYWVCGSLTDVFYMVNKLYSFPIGCR